MRRRDCLGFLAVAVASRPIITLAQISPRRPLIAVVIGASQAASERWLRGLPQGLQELGYVEGRDYQIEYGYADGDVTRLPALVDELIRHNPNVIVVGNDNAALLAKQATASIPLSTLEQLTPSVLAWPRATLDPWGMSPGCSPVRIP